MMWMGQTVPFSKQTLAEMSIMVHAKVLVIPAMVTSNVMRCGRDRCIYLQSTLLETNISTPVFLSDISMV